MEYNDKMDKVWPANLNRQIDQGDDTEDNDDTRLEINEIDVDHPQDWGKKKLRKKKRRKSFIYQNIFSRQADGVRD